MSKVTDKPEVLPGDQHAGSNQASALCFPPHRSAKSYDETRVLPRPITIPHPLECVPRRERKSKWLPRRDRRDCSPWRPSQPKLEGWHSPVLHIAEDTQPVRINFTYRNGGTSTAARFSVKARSLQYTEGPHESRYFRFLETDYRVCDFQFQIARIEWRTSAGFVRSYTFDGGRQDETGAIIFFEIKAHQAYFDEPETDDRLQEAEKELARHGIKLERIVGERFEGAIVDTINEVYMDRAASFSGQQECLALEQIEKDGGVTPLGKLRECIHADHRHGRAIANAMLVRRIVGFSLRRPLTVDTPVHRPARLPAGVRPLRNLKI